MWKAALIARMPAIRVSVPRRVVMAVSPRSLRTATVWNGSSGTLCLMRVPCLLLMWLLPAALVAQTPTQATKPATPAAKPASPATPGPSARKPTPAPAAARPATLTSDEQKTIYALGLFMQQRLAQFDLSAAELEIVKRAMTDATAGKPAIVPDDWGPQIDPLARARREAHRRARKTASVAFSRGRQSQRGQTESGLVYRNVTAGTGPSPAATDTVRVHYRGTLVNGTEFDSSYSRNRTDGIQIERCHPCWTEVSSA